MDLPSSVSDSIGILVEYSYLADGSKTGALREDGTGLIYRGPFVYRRSASGDLELESAAFGHGRLTPDGLLLQTFRPSLKRITLILTIRNLEYG